MITHQNILRKHYQKTHYTLGNSRTIGHDNSSEYTQETLSKTHYTIENSRTIGHDTSSEYTQEKIIKNTLNTSELKNHRT